MKQADPVIYDHICNIEYLCQQKNKVEKQKIDDKRRDHLFENIFIYNGVDFHKQLIS